jgi:hypothetical protein
LFWINRIDVGLAKETTLLDNQERYKFNAEHLVQKLPDVDVVLSLPVLLLAVPN